MDKEEVDHCLGVSLTSSTISSGLTDNYNPMVGAEIYYVALCKVRCKSE